VKACLLIQASRRRAPVGHQRRTAGRAASTLRMAPTCC